MVEKGIQKKNKATDIERPNDFESFVDMAGKMSDTPVCEPRCKLCNSKFRLEAEQEWDRVKNFAAVYRILKNHGEDISEAAVRCHLRDHYAKDVRTRQLKEYAVDLSENWLKINQSTEEKLLGYLALIDQRIHTLAAATDKNDPCDMRKTNDSIAKLIEQACKVEERLQKMKEANAPANILIDKFKNIILVQVENIKSTEAKQALMQVLDAVQNEVGEVELNG